MNEIRLLKAVGFPKATHIMRTLPYNQLEDKLNPVQKKVISDHVVSRGIRILATIQTNNTNIEPFESETERYDSIILLLVSVHDLRKSNQIYKMFMNIIPNPLVILFFDGSNTKWILATHIKKKDGFLTHDRVYEFNKIIMKNAEQFLEFDSFNKDNLKLFYESWIEQLLHLELKARYNIYAPVSLESNLLEELVIMDSQIEDYIKRAKQEKQLNKRIEMQQAANRIKLRKQSILEKKNKKGEQND
ncbi:DUF4391 domain-containing protein [Exiguobacterium sp.]|uniref:DUF4391 domain-containing protein n=1 Tax=Exiguobacterium sp. TaxID=44751 RepID=UPI0028A1D866|nr:DUF4391 domain-containing protein [Exiguobacterium sp.]